MKSFFNKPAWAATQDDTQRESGTDFYRRSEQTYSDIVAANREAHKKKPEAKMSQNIKSEEAKHSKRPRLSDETGNKDAVTAPSPLAENRRSEEDRKAPLHTFDTPIVLEKAGYVLEETQPQTPIRGASDMSSMNTPSTIFPDQPYPSSLPQSADRKRPARLLESSGKAQDLTEELTAKTPGATAETRPTLSNPANDSIVQILITSEIPNTKPLLVQRKMTQGIREVRLEWCKRQGLSAEEQPSVYLTWRGRRLFDVTTCRSLGINVEPSNSFSEMDDDFDLEPRELRIHMEAVTENPLLLNRAGPSPAGGEPSAAPPNPDDEQNAPMKLILRSPGFGDLKIKARPNTIVSKLTSAFRNQKGIPAEDEVFLVFDGDQLDPSSCLRDHDIADLDMLDIQIKSHT